ncbi:M48 family metallopeptidase [Methylococcus sp. EFPC2]|uniref:M48 family metallopeptidase n=1 Tax=Methylococcus sp. EFPC2 TaxID=2812648 RepID=UPI0019685B1D|nr:M48 family metallopeptidase [Methylococcus sp. EFPC2]QSA96688.1 M48 family metallopeptidase [Methylococcus sp. EFPC2]
MPSNTMKDYTESHATAVELQRQHYPGLFMLKFMLLVLFGSLLIFGFYFVTNSIGVVAGVAGALIFWGFTIERFLDSVGYLTPLTVFFTLITLNFAKTAYAPRGYELTAARFPELFAQLEKLNQKHRAPRIHKVLLEHTCNAGIVHRPRLVFLGWNEHTLVLGMEMLLFMSPEQMQSVLAHEWGHLSGRNERIHARIGLILFYFRAAWDVVEKRFPGRWAGLLHWYLSTLTVYSIIYGRSNEFRADATAARLVGQERAAEGLLIHTALPRLLDRYYWEPLFDLTRVLPQPVASPYKNLQAFLRDRPFSLQEVGAEIRQELSQKTDSLDRHPCLGERLAALQIAPDTMRYAPEKSAAEAWFGEDLDALIAEMDKTWGELYRSCWSERYREHRASD